ncbi:S9 family peptidase [Alicyclobacillus sp. TC]|uniref:alpha/beta hydrolase family protein n=1 Tax=Alicyclobacillus sp. TC TaxID=2606450 RepID=UPI001EE43860|nr:alpha/beta fold hydrolase [Alicyclobacillus sp. TC]
MPLLKPITFISILVLMATMMTGCDVKSHPHLTPLPQSTSSQLINDSSIGPFAIHIHTQDGKNGQLASVGLVSLPTRSTSGLSVYQVFYWSQGQQVEAYLTLPSKPGDYPLLVLLHGGWEVPKPGMYHSPFSWPVSNQYSNQIITIASEYRGYVQSEGTVHGLLGDLDDTEAAIQWASHIPGYSIRGLYLFGESLGGGVALQYAAQHHVDGVVALSPYVGPDAMDNWSKKLDWRPDPAAEYATAYGPEYLHGKLSLRYEKRSPYDQALEIQAPVLFLQGQEDHHVIWQSVAAMALRMKKAGKDVKLLLYKYGHHGLQKKYRSVTHQAIEKWFEQHGLPGPWPTSSNIH